MPGCFCIDEVNAKLCASVMCKQACLRLSAWVLFLKVFFFLQNVDFF